MNEQSHAALEHRCLVCGAAGDSANVSSDSHLQASAEHPAPVRWGLCAGHRKFFDAGLVALVECDPRRSGAPSGGDRVKAMQAHRTGRVSHIRRETLQAMFDVPAGHPCVFVEPGFIDWIEPMLGMTKH